MNKQQINDAVKKRQHSFLEEAETKPLTEEERKKQREMINKYKPDFIK